jgi:hypothetical protein
MTRYITVSLALATLLSCSTTKKAGNATAKAPKKPVACASAKLAGSHLTWYEVDTSVAVFPKGARMPASYKVYELDSAELAGFVNSGAQAWQTAVPLPDPTGCQVVSLKQSKTMSEELKKKFPNMVSLQGKSEANPESDVRLDYDGTKLRGQIRWGKDVYIINPVVNGKQTYYVIFDKKNAGARKQPFEQRGVNKKVPTYDR